MPGSLQARLRQVRQHSLELVAPLQPEDLCLQGMADASPPKWHLGHTTWFFETFLLRPRLAAGDPIPFTPADSRWGYLFNSYYDAVGDRHPRPQRGLLSRPPMHEVIAWRAAVDRALDTLVEQLIAPPPEPGRTPTGGAATAQHPPTTSSTTSSTADSSTAERQELLALLELGLQHEQQHQELLLMDLLDGFSRNPLQPAYGEEPERRFEAAWRAGGQATPAEAPEEGPWLEHSGGLEAIGHDGAGFHFDNEAPRHRQWLEPFAIADRLVTNAEFAAFIADGGYSRPELWMSEGWAVVIDRGWKAPRYWLNDGTCFTLAGPRPLEPRAPVRHLSWFEADAYARWSGARLPTEAEWEAMAPRLGQAFGVLWQWTSTAYRPYPGFRPAPGAVGEYNGKFMSSQMVLRGSCFLTPEGHARTTYRNFYPPSSRWMASGLRLARDRQ